MNWQPLTDHWEKYQENLEAANEAGLLDDPEEAQDIIFPYELHLGEGEKDDVRDFVTNRLNELYHNFTGDFNPNMLGTYIFRSVLLGMMWEKERIGR